MECSENRFYITANKNHPGNREFYQLSTTGILTPILTKAGAYEVVLSPDEKRLLVRYSHANQPWELAIASNKAHAQLTPITQSLTPEFKAYSWRSPEVLSL